MGDDRKDGPSWFKQWRDAYEQARFRADIVGVRYRVTYEPENRWWQLTETHTPLPGRERIARNGGSDE